MPSTQFYEVKFAILKFMTHFMQLQTEMRRLSLDEQVKHNEAVSAYESMSEKVLEFYGIAQETIFDKKLHPVKAERQS